jgi:hypothetical protein
MEASKKTVPDAGGNQQAGHWGMLRFFYYEDTHLCCALHCSALLFRRALGLTLPLGGAPQESDKSGGPAF